MDASSSSASASASERLANLAARLEGRIRRWDEEKRVQEEALVRKRAALDALRSKLEEGLQQIEAGMRDVQDIRKAGKAAIASKASVESSWNVIQQERAMLNETRDKIQGCISKLHAAQKEMETAATVKENCAAATPSPLEGYITLHVALDNNNGEVDLKVNLYDNPAAVASSFIAEYGERVSGDPVALLEPLEREISRALLAEFQHQRR